MVVLFSSLPQTDKIEVMYRYSTLFNPSSRIAGLEITFPNFPIMVIGSHDFPCFSGWKPCFSADHKQFLADH
jgi:hypothetical protein